MRYWYLYKYIPFGKMQVLPLTAVVPGLVRLRQRGLIVRQVHSLRVNRCGTISTTGGAPKFHRRLNWEFDLPHAD